MYTLYILNSTNIIIFNFTFIVDVFCFQMQVISSTPDVVDHDRSSVYSGSDSNTDSGRGCSEEGEASMSALSHSKSGQSFAPSLRSAQVVPLGPNKSYSPESTYSSNQDWPPVNSGAHGNQPRLSDGTSPQLNTAFNSNPTDSQRKSRYAGDCLPGYHRYGLPLDTVSEDGGSTTSGNDAPCFY